MKFDFTLHIIKKQDFNRDTKIPKGGVFLCVHARIMYMKFKNLFQGRLGRVRYFSYILVILSVFILLLVSVRNIFGVMGDEIFIFYAVFFFAVVILTIRRLHDLNLSGWWALLIPISFAITMGMLLAFIFSPSTPFFVTLIIWSMLGLNIVAFSLLIFWKGTAGSNRFGEGPLK